ncbi:MAG: nucleoside-diphosphate kinase [Candidatus Omnitrophica bacterium]|nr:nucleoside-diphosphate kinase [Candidatus Omnitrophota bacterium]
MAEEATLVIIKPDAIQRGLMGAALSRLEELRLEVIGAKAVRVSQELAEAHYDHLREKPFFQEIVDYLQGKLHETRYVLAVVLWGEDAIGRVRQLTGATHPEQAHPTSIRGAFGRMRTAGLMENVMHASSDRREAEREISLWFKPHELLRDVTRGAARLNDRNR